MTIMIGIHQKQDKVDKLYENMGLHAASLAAVGPFTSKKEATEWLHDVQLKTGDCKIIEPAGADCEDTPWYGFTFEK
ncbi:MAG: hypothetical protein PHI97_26750 [Desulfobulbus sp.]|nr:hypothetical protein [Desulfobulbus sp.]